MITFKPSTLILIMTSVCFTTAIPVGRLHKKNNILAKFAHNSLNSKKLTNSSSNLEANNRTFHSPYIDYNDDPFPGHYSSIMMKERPPPPPPPYPLHMIERWQSYYGYDRPYVNSMPPYSASTIPHGDHFDGYNSRPSLWKPTEITSIPQLITKPRPPALIHDTSFISTTKATFINNHKNPISSSHNHMTASSTILELHEPTESSIPVQGKPVTVFVPSPTPITKVASAKQKIPTVIFSRPITVVHPDKYVNTTLHSNLIVAQKHRPNLPSRRPGTTFGLIPNRPLATSQAYVAIQSPLPFMAPIIVPRNIFSMLITGIQAMNNIIKSTIWSTIAFFIPSAILALGLFAANNRENPIDLPPVPSMSAGPW